MRIPYYCPYCDQRSTRRWNLDVHIKRRHGGYLLGRSSANNLPLYSNSVQFGHATIADSVGDTFQPKYFPQQAPQQYSIHRSLPTMDDQRYRTGLSQETTQKIDELKRLVYKYRQYQNIDPDEIVKWAIYCSSNGDNTLLDQKLEQLRTIDSLAKFYVGPS